MLSNRSKLILIGVSILEMTIIFIIFEGSKLKDNICCNSSKPVTFLGSVDDYYRLLNISFKFSVMNQVCHENTPLLALILVFSATSNVKKRHTIRSTWGQVEKNKKLLFMLGDPGSPKQQKDLEVESLLFGDIVQGNFRDTYKNLTYKHVMVLKYFVYHCPQAKFLIKTDDDVFINWPSMENFLTYDLSPSSDRPTIYCFRKTGSPVERSNSKWVVTYSEYPEAVYPPYCIGCFIIYTPEVIFSLYKEAQRSNSFLWVDDAFITGILFKKLNYSHTDIEFLMLSDENFYAILRKSTNVEIKPFLFRLLHYETEMKIVWEYISNQVPPRSIYKF
ncbi:beta-1,3-galactosyltransferase 5-like isoform X1 [Diabrotica virgifera virgifera]|uniref:Hexosyltransferase n=1 Tax=Diabrotica virgifera virgifera TaxID=50390 RepID=A0ABM5L3T0_DIAVI|nr:beta-1,3-galactosyltransferase 5-like isoform X1 [Diabrotica virgifera virgifera]XP_050517101.1 beta-1,3-galactosyltransferase 5-like isoform X1 [Diabrotica virgifera virgifera]